jgi:hypothetical protein
MAGVWKPPTWEWPIPAISPGASSPNSARTLSAELDHRVKNVLARVAAVVRHTRRRGGTPDEFVKRSTPVFNQRSTPVFNQIAAAHALLSQSRWYGVGLTDLIRHQLAPYTTEANTAMSGPDVMLTSGAPLRRGLRANGAPSLHQLRCDLTGAFDEALDNWT